MKVFWRSVGLEWSWNYERQMHVWYSFYQFLYIKQIVTQNKVI
ncbi:MAG: hypothetical protein ACK5G7_03630 [Erysipelotrichaceae bacterium]